MPNLSSPVYSRLLKTGHETHKQQTAFKKSKELLQSSPLLLHFDPSKELLVSVMTARIVLQQSVLELQHASAARSRNDKIAQNRIIKVVTVSLFHC